MRCLQKTRTFYNYNSKHLKICYKPPNRILSDTTHKKELHNLESSAIIVSHSRDIFKNLALEDWLYKHHNFQAKHVYLLLMWYNAPCVVIGRHQNPWLECSVDFCQSSGISVARRNSGGGTVYHDLGNLNCCFMSPRNRYDRKANLSLICETLMNKWPLDLSLSDREDILLNGKYKISGTASKLGKNNAYHHCTILINVDLDPLHQALHREVNGVESKATSSVKSDVKNIQSVCSDVTVAAVVKALEKQYQSLYKVPPLNCFKIDPCEELFPGIKNIEDDLKSWQWRFGKTPKFSIIRQFPLCPSFSKGENHCIPLQLDIKLRSYHGIVENIAISPNIMTFKNVEQFEKYLIGTQFSPNGIENSLLSWIDVSEDKVFSKFIKSCILQMVYDVYR